MKKVFIGAVVKQEPDYDKVKELINNIPEKKVAICYSNQFIDVAKKISEIIDKEVLSSFQVLGCSNPKFKEEVEAIIIIGQGKFHSVSLAYESKLPTYVVEGSSLNQITEEEILKMERKEKGALLKYITSNKIGILVTTKPGQMRFEKALEYNRQLKEKKGYVFMDNNLNTAEFENYGIDCWVNTACPRMDLNEGAIMNLDKIPKELIK